MFIVLHRQTTDFPERFQVSRIDSYRDEGNDFTIVRETPAEIAALVAAEQRKRDRLMLAGQIVTGLLTNLPYRADGDFARQGSRQAVVYADALLAALDAREGAE